MINVVNVINILQVIKGTVSDGYSSPPVCLQFTLMDVGAENYHGLKEREALNTVKHHL